MAIYNRVVTARFSVAVNDGLDPGQSFDNPYLSGVTAQFVPRQDWLPDGTTTMFLTTIEGTTDSTGHLRSLDGSIGVSLPIRDPLEGVTIYKVRVIPPDGATLRPYEFPLYLTPGDAPIDISTVADAFPSVAYPGGIIAGFAPPAPRHRDGVYFDLTDVNSEGVLMYLPQEAFDG